MWYDVTDICHKKIMWHLCHTIRECDTIMSYFSLNSSPYLLYMLCDIRCFWFVIFVTICWKKIARDSLSIYTHTAIWGVGVWQAWQFSTGNSTARRRNSEATARQQDGNWKRKTGTVRNPSLFRCENENKTRRKSKSINCKACFYLLSLLTLHAHKQQEKTI